MPPAPRRVRRASIRAAALLTLAAAAAGGASAASPEVRALWVVRTTLTSRESIASMVAAARASGFNTLLVQVRGRGDAYYADGLEPRASQLAAAPFDPLETTLTLAHAAGLKVHAWVNIGLVAGADLPAARNHVVYRHPEWVMVPRALARPLAGVDPRSPAYLDGILRYARDRASDVEGLYLSPVPVAAAEYTVAVVADIAQRYPIDGVHVDYARFPNDDFDFSRESLATFRSSVAADVTAAERRRLDARAADDPAVWTQMYPERWRAFRQARLTMLIARLRDEVKRRRPAAIVSAAVGPDPADAAARRLQDWRSWVDRGLLDAICPMAYTTDGRQFATQIAMARDLAGRHAVWAGIGAYRLSAAEIVRDVDTARQLGAGGIALFSYDSLTAASRAGDLAQVGRAAFQPF